MGAPGSGRRIINATFVPAAGREVYERQPGEGPKPWAAFILYRDMGPDRTTDKVRKRLGKTKKSYNSLLEQWSVKFGWRSRIEAQSLEDDRRARDIQSAAVEKAHKEMAMVAESLWKLAAKDLIKWHRKIDRAPADTPLLSPKDIHRLAEAGIKLHRLIVGEPTVIEDVHHEVSVSDKRTAVRTLLGDKRAMKAVDELMEVLDSGGRNGT